MYQAYQRFLRAAGTYLMLGVMVSACAQLAPSNFQESLVATEVGATTARQMGTEAALANKITRTQAQFVQNQADLVVAGVKTAREMNTTNPSGAEQQLALTQSILKTLRDFLIQRGATPK